MGRITPPHLALALDRVKAFVSKHPNGVDVSDLLKVEAYTFLNKKAREQLLDVIERYNQLVVVRSGKPGRESIWLRHKRYEPDHIDECTENGSNEFHYEISNRPAESAANLLSDVKNKENEVMETNTKRILSPLELRKQAEDLLRQAEDAERSLTAKDIFQKQLEPVRREVLLAHTKLTKGFETMVDGMAELDKAIAKLRDFKIAP
ncbi:hypothetical protein NK099_003465 [Salmonella enterica]|nr:hypothetical protein [Salmonella enterica]EJK1420395.1 hypothetical protein [Salmonella enterica]